MTTFHPQQLCLILPLEQRAHWSKSYQQHSSFFVHSRPYDSSLSSCHSSEAVKMCLPCFPWTWTEYEDPLDSMPEQHVWVHDGQAWPLQRCVSEGFFFFCFKFPSWFLLFSFLFAVHLFTLRLLCLFCSVLISAPCCCDDSSPPFSSSLESYSFY